MTTAPRPINAMSVDVEEYFHASALERVAPRDAWTTLPSRVVPTTQTLLDLFASREVRATFFILGWVADRYPALVRDIAAAGHEVASHGYWHQIVYSLTPADFREDIRRSKQVLESLTGQAVHGYRAPSFSITKQSLWALVAGQVTSYVKARGESLGLDADGGLAARADRIVVAFLGLVLAGLGVPFALQVAVLVLAVLGSWTVGQRMLRAWRSREIA